MTLNLHSLKNSDNIFGEMQKKYYLCRQINHLEAK